VSGKKGLWAHKVIQAATEARVGAMGKLNFCPQTYLFIAARCRCRWPRWPPVRVGPLGQEVWHVGVRKRKQHYLLIPHNGCHLAHQLWALIYGGICQLTMCSSRNPPSSSQTSRLCKVESDEKLKPLVAVIEFVTRASYLLYAINKS